MARRFKLTGRHILLSLSLIATLSIGHGETAKNGPVKVYILSGQSNMVGKGQVSGCALRWGKEFSNPVLSVYPEPYDASADYEKIKPSGTLKLESFGGTSPTPYPNTGVQIVRGEVAMPVTGVYEFRPGYCTSKENIMLVDGKEIYRKEPGSKAKHTPLRLEAGQKVPFKITYLNAKANGFGWYARLDIPGTLKSVVHHEGKFQYLADDEGNFVSRDDVWYCGVISSKGKWPLGVPPKGPFGPELGFGHFVGNLHDEPVLILKSSQGNRSLNWDFLPPNSERFEHTEADGTTYIYAAYKETPARWKKGTEPVKPTHNWYAGKQYDKCFDAAKGVLANFDKEFPHWAGRGYEIAGFAWWQGHKDGGEQGTGTADASAVRYEHNLATLINTLREEFEAPDAPFVVATCGFNGGKGWEPGSSADTIFNAQLNVSDPAKHPNFAGNVASVDTRPFYRPPEVSPRNQSFHYHRNAETYMLVGEAMGKAMVELVR